MRGSTVYYARRAGSVAFVDRDSRRLDIHDTETAAVLAALLSPLASTSLDFHGCDPGQ